MRQETLILLKQAAWAPIAVVVAHAIFGELLGHEPYVDPISHFLGGAAIAYFVRAAGRTHTVQLGNCCWPSDNVPLRPPESVPPSRRFRL